MLPDRVTDTSPSSETRPLTSSGDDTSLGTHLVARTQVLLDRYPLRLTGTSGERGLQEACAKELEELGGVTEWHGFRWGRSIYASLAFHFGLATAALVLGFWAPAVAAGLHLLVAVSYASESALKRPILRWALPAAVSQNAVVTFASRRPMTHRIVTLAHADAAYTGVLFTPSIVRMAAKETKNPIGRLFRKGLALATFSLVALAAVELVTAWLSVGIVGRAIPSVLLALPSLAAFILNADVVIRNRVVPAANDNLSGCVATLELARRLAKRLPDDIELVTVITGCEEAGAGGAANLARDFVAARRWSTADTTVLALDTFSGGEPRLLQEGELFARPIPPRLGALAEQVCSEHPDVGPVTPYEIPSGATDAWPFLIAGFESLAITCIDPALGAPKNYHLPTDTAENLDAAAFAKTFAFTEKLIAALAAERSRATT
ncbi:MAG: M28 family peptidase [Labilithrix sp.]|nr:M28 family peptidase [Labilithrix sp.]